MASNDKSGWFDRALKKKRLLLVTFPIVVACLLGTVCLIVWSCLSDTEPEGIVIGVTVGSAGFSFVILTVLANIWSKDPKRRLTGVEAVNVAGGWVLMASTTIMVVVIVMGLFIQGFEHLLDSGSIIASVSLFAIIFLALKLAGHVVVENDDDGD